VGVQKSCVELDHLLRSHYAGEVYLMVAGATGCRSSSDVFPHTSTVNASSSWGELRAEAEYKSDVKKNQRESDCVYQPQPSTYPLVVFLFVASIPVLRVIPF
jgi:hypothetical protein